MADNQERKTQKKELIGIPSLDYSNDEELNEDTRLMYERYNQKMDETAPKPAPTLNVQTSRVEFDVSMDLCIFMRDRTGIHVQLDEGHNAEAEDLFDIALQEQGLPAECEDVFALWLVSPLLELRLKKKHKPFYMVQQWDELCAKYTDAKAEDIHEAPEELPNQGDFICKREIKASPGPNEPVLMLQRNVFFPKEQEKNITAERVLGYLYHEAKFNVIEGRYILQPQDYHTLAGIQALLTIGKYNQRDHLIETYRANIHQFYPEHMHRKQTSGFSLLKKNRDSREAGVEEHWQNAHRQVSQEFEHADIDANKGDLYRRYLELLWPYPFYGAAFFDSFIDKPQGKLGFLKRSHNIETWTAINTNGVCVIDRDKDIVLLAAPYTELCWEYGEPQFDVDDDSFPSLYLQFLVHENSPEGSNRRVTKILQVYSRQAKMMQALIESCVERKKLKNQGITSTVQDEVDAPALASEFHAKFANKLDKMCLSTFSCSGECLD